MKTTGWIGLLGAALVWSLGTVGCGDASESAEVFQADPFPDGAGQSEWYQEGDYPDAPTGWLTGSILPNFEFLALPNFADPDIGDIMFVISMADFYNPTGTEVYPEGSPFGAGTPKPKAIMLDMSAVWCPPCKYQSGEVMPGEYAIAKPLGGQFLTVLTESFTPGDQAEVKDLFSWANSYLSGWDATGSVYVLGIDPASKITALFEPAYPSNAIIRTSDMKIMHTIAGVAGEGGDTTFFPKFLAVIDGTYPEP